MAGKTIHEVLADIQANLNAPKDQFNSFGKYRYRSAESILQALKPLLKQHGARLVLSDEIEAVLDRVYVKATAALYVGDGSAIAHAYAREEPTKKGMDAAQITGSASSYARKYALSGLFAIDDGGDPDQTNDHGEGGAGAKPGRKAMTRDEKDATHYKRKVCRVLDMCADAQNLKLEVEQFAAEAKELGLVDWLKAEYRNRKSALEFMSKEENEMASEFNNIVGEN